jgi:GMP synthase-like glutamine amidotransferase
MAGGVVALRHVPFEHLGRISDSLDSLRLKFDYVDLAAGDRTPDIAAAAGLIVMGGPMSANDDAPYIRQELELIGEAVSLGKPVLGICLGAQLIAKALGAHVYKNTGKEIGWYPVYWTEAGRESLQLGDPETVFHWHGETFELPEGAELLGYSDRCRHQAYRVGKNIYGFQFHLEVTPEMIADWLRQDANCGDLREIEQAIDPAANAVRMQELAAQVFGGWCRLALQPGVLSPGC